MGKRREPMSESKKNIIASLIQEYDIKTAEDIQDALKDLLGSAIQSMLEAEIGQPVIICLFYNLIILNK